MPRINIYFSGAYGATADLADLIFGRDRRRAWLSRRPRLHKKGSVAMADDRWSDRLVLSDLLSIVLVDYMRLVAVILGASSLQLRPRP